jgi:hypothetical protein
MKLQARRGHEQRSLDLEEAARPKKGSNLPKDPIPFPQPFEAARAKAEGLILGTRKRSTVAAGAHDIDAPRRVDRDPVSGAGAAVGFSHGAATDGKERELLPHAREDAVKIHVDGGIDAVDASGPSPYRPTRST